MTDAKALAASAEHSFEAGNYPSALERAQAAIAVDPLHEKAWSILVQSVFATGDNKKALDIAERWAVACPESAQAQLRYTMMRILVGGNKAKAKAALETFTLRFPLEQSSAKWLKALYEIQLGSDNRAEKLSSELAAEYPELSEILLLRTANLYALNRLESAYKMAREAFTLNPDDVGVLRWLCISAYRTMRYPAALRASRRGKALDPQMRIFGTVEKLSVVSWFPPILFAQLLYRAIHGISGMLRGPDILRWGVTLVVAVVVTRLALAPLSGALLSWLESIGMHYLFMPFIAAFLVFAIIPEVMINFADRLPRQKQKSVQVKDY